MIKEDNLRNDLQSYSKDELINLFIKLKKAYFNACQRLDKVENELLYKTSLDELIDSIDGE